MPTTRPRHAVTETDDVARALDAAARRWPDLAGNRSRLLLRLIEVGHRALTTDAERDVSERREAIAAAGGALTGRFGSGYLDDLRRDWPR